MTVPTHPPKKPSCGQRPGYNLSPLPLVENNACKRTDAVQPICGDALHDMMAPAIGGNPVPGFTMKRPPRGGWIGPGGRALVAKSPTLGERSCFDVRPQLGRYGLTTLTGAIESDGPPAWNQTNYRCDSQSYPPLRWSIRAAQPATPGARSGAINDRPASVSGAGLSSPSLHKGPVIYDSFVA
jgi:hypothetical protein